MFSFGTGELILILVIALVIVGPDKIPQLARKIATFIHQLRSVKDDVEKKISISSNDAIDFSSPSHLEKKSDEKDNNNQT